MNICIVLYVYIYIYIYIYVCIYIYGETHYIDIQSDHPPSITKQFLKKFYKTAQYYEQRPASCGYNEKLTYQQQGENIGNIKNMRKNRKRNIIDESQCLQFLPVDACGDFVAGETLNKRDEFS